MPGATQSSVYDFSALAADGHEVPFAQYRGKVLLIVNTASRCGYTPQYTGLEALYQQFKDRGLVVLGFPCNQFGAQEPGTEVEIARFCEVNYKITFPLFAKTEVNGPNTLPLYQFLKSEKRGIFGTESIKWNFTKFLIDGQGRVAGRYGSATAPSALSRSIEKLLPA